MRYAEFEKYLCDHTHDYDLIIKDKFYHKIVGRVSWIIESHIWVYEVEIPGEARLRVYFDEYFEGDTDKSVFIYKQGVEVGEIDLRWIFLEEEKE